MVPWQVAQSPQTCLKRARHAIQTTQQRPLQAWPRPHRHKAAFLKSKFVCKNEGKHENSGSNHQQSYLKMHHT